MMSSAPAEYLVENTHDGLVLEFPRRPPTSGTVIFGLIGWLLVGWASLWALAMPGAALVEALGWWAVNERVLEFRWMAIGMPLWPVLFSMGWLWARGPQKLRVKVDRHALRWRGRLGWRRVAWSEVENVWMRPRHLAIATRDGRVHLLPALPGPAMRGLYLFVRRQWADANHGRDDEVPSAMRDLVAQRAAQSASSIR